MITPQEGFKNTLTSIFERKGGAGTFTKRFEAFAPAEQNQLLQDLKMGQDELPVIAGIMTDDRRILITTERIMQFENNAWSVIIVSDIIGVAPVQFGSIKKAEMEKLAIKTKTGSNKYLTVESGKPYFGIWNMLLNIVARNR